MNIEMALPVAGAREEITTILNPGWMQDILSLNHSVCDPFSLDAHGYFILSFAPIKRVRIIGNSGNRVRKGGTSGAITIIAAGTNAPERPGLLTRRIGGPDRDLLPRDSEVCK